MKQDKMAQITIFFMALLLVFIGWAFYKTLTFTQSDETNSQSAAQKAVMDQAETMNLNRLESLAKSGRVEIGMTMAQVQMALGKPYLVENIDGESPGTVWWYNTEPRINIVFDKNGKVKSINKYGVNNK